MKKKPYSQPLAREVLLRFEASFLQSTLHGNFGNTPIEDGDSGPAL